MQILRILHDLRVAHFEPDRESAEKIAIPKGGFDSGILEFFFDAADPADPAAMASIHSIELIDETKWPPPK